MLPRATEDAVVSHMLPAGP